METAPEDFKVPDEIVHDGMIINGASIIPKEIARIADMDTTEQDVLVATYPRSGTTWLIEIVRLLIQDGDKATISAQKPECLYYLDLYPRGPQTDPITLANSKCGEKRILKTHLPAKYVQKQIEDGKAKVLCCLRNPKDQLVSYYKFYQMNAGFGNFPGTWNEFFELFRKKGLMYGDWLDFNKSYWPFRARDNVMFLTYEEMKQDSKKAIANIAKYLNLKCSEEDIETICKLTNFQTMKNNAAVNRKNAGHMKKDMDFMRKGEMGAWKSVFTVEQSEYVDAKYGSEIEKLGMPVIYE